MKTIFVYGTLKRGFHNHDFLDTARFLGEDSVSGELYRDGRLPLMIKGEGTVHGELFEVQEERMALLDRLEGHPTWYRREPVVTHSGKQAEAYFFQTLPLGVTRVESGTWK